MTEKTLLLRQIHPLFIQEGRVTSQAFRPTPKDQKKLSVYDGDLITAERSWVHFRDRGLQQGLRTSFSRVFGGYRVNCHNII